MKPILITSAVSLAIGFAGGWMINSASQDLESFEPGANRPPTRVSPTPPSNPDTIPDRPQREQVTPVPELKGTITADDIEIPESAKLVDRAKWTRLIEVLGLNTDQAKALQANIDEIKPKPNPEESPDLAYVRAGDELQAAVLALLSPEQQEAFRKFQERSLENKVEVKAHETFANELGGLDLTPAQREQALELLRENAESDISSISANTRLLLKDSILPIGNEQFSEDGILLLRRIRKEGGADISDTSVEDIAAIQRANIEEKMSFYESVLTPGQLERYQALLGESLENLEILSPQN